MPNTLRINRPDGARWLRVTSDEYQFLLERYAPPQEGRARKGDGFGRPTYHGTAPALAAALVKEGALAEEGAASVQDLTTAGIAAVRAGIETWLRSGVADA